SPSETRAVSTAGGDRLGSGARLRVAPERECRHRDPVGEAGREVGNRAPDELDLLVVVGRRRSVRARVGGDGDVDTLGRVGGSGPEGADLVEPRGGPAALFAELAKRRLLGRLAWFELSGR